MNRLSKLLLAAAIPLAALSACGGGSDLADRLDVADPVLRFVHASPVAGNVTLYNNDVARADVTNVPYKFASDYFNIDMGVSTWSVKTTPGNVLVGSNSIDPVRGSRYTIVAVPGTTTDSSTYVIVDPYNKPLGSTSTRLRLMNASFNANSVDVYMNAVGTDITTPGVNPLIAATVYKTSGPASGSDSVDLPGGTYQLSITNAGTKTVIFKGQLTFGDNQDILLVTVPNTLLPGGISTLEKLNGIAGATEITPL
jgi:Domain of unknown function (DUF4397)